MVTPASGLHALLHNQQYRRAQHQQGAEHMVQGRAMSAGGRKPCAGGVAHRELRAVRAGVCGIADIRYDDVLRFTLRFIVRDGYLRRYPISVRLIHTLVITLHDAVFNAEVDVVILHLDISGRRFILFDLVLTVRQPGKAERARRLCRGLAFHRLIGRRTVPLLQREFGSAQLFGFSKTIYRCTEQ